MSKANINKLANYIVHHVNERGNYYGKFPLSGGYVFTAPDISIDNIYFHLEKDGHTQRIYIIFTEASLTSNGKWLVKRFEDNQLVDKSTILFTTTDFTIEDAKKLIKDLPENDVKAYNQAFKILYPEL